MTSCTRCLSGCLAMSSLVSGCGSYLNDKDLNQTQRAYYACLGTRGYTLTK